MRGNPRKTRDLAASVSRNAIGGRKVAVEVSARVMQWSLHYRRVGILGGWDRERVLKCCRLLSETSDELAASCAIDPAQLSQWLSIDRVPSYVALLFHMREQSFLRIRFNEDH